MSHPTYEIRTIKDFASVPEDRLSDCLREFETYLRLVRESLGLLNEVTSEMVGREYRGWRDGGVFTWVDDGKRDITIRCRVATAPSTTETTNGE